MALKETTCSDCWEPSVTVTCDVCKHSTDHHGTVSQLIPWLERRGWTKKSGTKLSDPMLNVCPQCNAAASPVRMDP